MQTYLDENESIYSKCHDHVEDTLAVIANRYVGNHPPHPMVYRSFCADGILRMHDYRYQFNLVERFPELEDGQHIYAWAKMWISEAGEQRFSLNCNGPVRMYVNETCVYKSNLTVELNPESKAYMSAPMKRGWNQIILMFTKTASGCGGIWGTASSKSNPFHVLAPTPERDGQEGWIFSGPMNGELKELPDAGKSELAGPIAWYPQLSWSEQESKDGQMKRMFGESNGQFAFAWTKIFCSHYTQKTVKLSGVGHGALTLFIDGQSMFHSQTGGFFEVSLSLSYGTHDVVFQSGKAEEDWGFELDRLPDDCRLMQPYPVLGASDEWLYLGPFQETDAVEMESLLTMDHLFANFDGGTYWRIDLPNTWVRPYAENELFGKWNYPLGVTLYGLLQTGGELKRNDLIHYVYQHIETCTSLYTYALWDKKRYGASGILNTLATLDSLDDCGSFGASMLRACQQKELKGARETAEVIADYIAFKQDRQPNGALYRAHGSVDFMKDTVWCDDLYMSVPFLCQYYQLTGDIGCLDDAASQFMLYKELMFIPKYQVMSHVYDYKFNAATGVPWGRGNGWVLFSLSELLMVLPENNARRESLIRFFQELSEGYIRLQGVNGLWHQVLTDPESYEETSCTSMFIYAFARGIRYGWLDRVSGYIDAALKGWQGLTRISIDQLGNIYGVCRGSGYSFSASYYKDELSWRFNDTHGIGIVMLAGIEILRLKQWLDREA